MTFNESEFRALILEHLKIQERDYADTLSLGNCPTWDSLGHFQLIEAIESHFGVRFKSSEITELKSIGRIKSALQAKIV